MALQMTQPKPEQVATVSEITSVSLAAICEGERFRGLDRLEAYYRATQDDSKMYDWDGRFQGYGGEADIAPGWFVPYKHRRPATRYDLARVIVKRLTAFIFGEDRFPGLRIDGDEDAEDYVQALAEVSRLSQRMAEARDLGGSVGTVCLSFGFVDGKPRIEVHNGKHCTVLRWADKSERRVAAAIKAYRFPRWIIRDGKMRQVDFYAVRYWDEQTEIVWDPIPADIARQAGWWNAPKTSTKHATGICPFYWIQNTPDSVEDDGEPDYEGLPDLFDELNRLLSATTKGTRANVDPTLVMKADPAMNDGAVKKGSDNVIWSPGGADYLELTGQSQAAAEKQIAMLKQMALDSSGVVLADPEKLTGAAQSAAAMRMLYAPMITVANIRREQYGEFGIKPLMRDMLRMAKTLAATTVEVPDPADPSGAKTITRPAVILPKRKVEEEVETDEVDEELEKPKREKQVTMVDREPGESEEIELAWKPDFPPTWADIKAATEAAQLANGKKPVISQRTSVQSVGELFGVSDIESELAAIHEDAERDVLRQQELMAPGPGEDPAAAKGPGNAPPEPKE